MHIDILTLFPEMFQGPFDSSIIKRAREQGLISIKLWDIRDYSHDRHRTVDDSPYGGGAGMILKPEPAFEAAEAAGASGEGKPYIILLTPSGRLFTQKVAGELSRLERVMLICGHYEGVDERVSEHLVDDEISIGDYVLSGGELAAMVIADAVVRLLPGVLGSPASLLYDSHSEGLLEYPQYTRPAEYRGWQVPDVLLSGNHAEITRWRREQSILRTLKRRPELLAKANLSLEERYLIETK